MNQIQKRLITKASLSRIARLLLTSLLLTVGLFVVASPASADEGVERESICTGFPDITATYDFRSPCLKHDNCYLNKPYGPDKLGRTICDSDFYVNLHAACDSQHVRPSPVHEDCSRTAKLGFWVVSRFGERFFEAAGPGTYPFFDETDKATAIRYSSSAGEIFWDRAEDPDGYIYQYKIYRNGTLIAIKDAVSLWQDNLSAGTYHYRIHPVDNDGKDARPIYVTLRI